MSGVTLTIYFSSQGFETSHSKGCSSFHRFLNDHCLQRALLTRSQGGSLSVVLCYGLYRELLSSKGSVGVSVSSHLLFNYLRQLCHNYQITLVSVILKTRLGSFPIYGIQWFLRLYRFSLLIFLSLFFSLSTFYVYTTPSIDDYDSFIDSIQSVSVLQLQSYRQLSKDSEKLLKESDFFISFLSNPDYLLSNYFCNKSSCFLDFVVTKSNVDFFHLEFNKHCHRRGLELNDSKCFEDSLNGNVLCQVDVSL